ncbi:hypothetical protein MKW92_016710 [Papaver armeniacum]|nr:hypothetical protein MKW92_016710 [Papaver armeniacum]
MELQLTGWDEDNCENRIRLPLDMSFPRLELLHLRLEHISFGGDVNLTNRFFSSLPSLESLIMEMGYHGFHNTKLNISLPKLNYLSTEFSCQCLSSLVTADIEIRVRREDKVVGSYDIRPEKKEIYAQHAMGFLRGIHSVKVLKLRHSFLKQNHDKPPVYPFCDEVNINPENMGDYLDAGLSLPCMISQLKFVEIKGLRGCVNELKFLEFLLKHATVLEKLVLACYSAEQDSLSEKRMRNRMKKFREMLLKFPNASKNISISWKF